MKLEVYALGLIASMGLTPTLSAHALNLSLGPASGDPLPDDREYARSYQDKLFPDKSLKGQQYELSFQWSFIPIKTFSTAWILGLADLNSSMKDSYGGGEIKLERHSQYLFAGCRLQADHWFAPFSFGAELLFFNGIQGTVKLSTPVGIEKQKEKYMPLSPNAFAFSLTAGYRIMPELVLNTAVRVYEAGLAQIFLGISYDWSKLQ